MLVFAGVRRGTRWVRGKVAGSASAPSERTEQIPASSWHHGHHGLPGHHHHKEPDDSDEPMTYGRGTAFGVGMIHGVGAETPTQVVIFLAAAGAGGPLVGVLVLLAFIVGLLTSNSLITIGSAFGFLRASKNWGIYVAVAVITGVFSLAIGTLFLVGKETVLPALFGG